MFTIQIILEFYYLSRSNLTGDFDGVVGVVLPKGLKMPASSFFVWFGWMGNGVDSGMEPSSVRTVREGIMECSELVKLESKGCVVESREDVPRPDCDDTDW